MNYWMEDYESGESRLSDFKDEIIKKCKDAIDKNNKVRIGNIMLEEMKINASKSDLAQIVFALQYTGKYQFYPIKHENGRDDFLVTKIPKKSWKERYWWAIAIFAFVIGFFSDLGKEVWKQKILQPSQESKQASPTLPDTSQIHKIQ